MSLSHLEANSPHSVRESEASPRSGMSSGIVRGAASNGTHKGGNWDMEVKIAPRSSMGNSGSQGSSTCMSAFCIE